MKGEGVICSEERRRTRQDISLFDFHPVSLSLLLNYTYPGTLEIPCVQSDSLLLSLLFEVQLIVFKHDIVSICLALYLTLFLFPHLFIGS